jgi:hypothetical protein
MMATPNIAQLEYLFQELDFRMKSLNAAFFKEMSVMDDLLKTCQEMTVVQASEKKHQRYLS